MSSDNNRDASKIFYILFILNLFSKLLLLNWNEAEYTDSVFYVTSESIGRSKWLPVYPILVQVAHRFVSDLTLSGKLTAVIMSSLCVLPLYAIAKRTFNTRTAQYTVMLYIVAPVVLRWSIRAMSESSFLFFLLISLWCLIKWEDGSKGFYGLGFIGFSGITALARPEGLALLPLALLFALRVVRQTGLRSAPLLACGFLSWCLLFLWHTKIVGKFIYGHDFIHGAMSIAFKDYISHFILYAVYIPYLLTPLVFLSSAYGAVKSYMVGKKEHLKKVYILFFLYLLITWLLILPLYWPFWTTRFMFSIVVLSLVLSGYGLSLFKKKISRRVLLGACLATSIIFTTIVLFCSKETYGDIRAASMFVRNSVPHNAEIVSSELVKTQFWIGRSLVQYSHSVLKPGQYVLLQNMYSCDIEKEMKFLRKNFVIDVLYQKFAVVIPILADDIFINAERRSDGRTALRGRSNRAIDLKTQFGKSRFASIVIHIRGKKQAHSGNSDMPATLLFTERSHKS